MIRERDIKGNGPCLGKPSRVSAADGPGSRTAIVGASRSYRKFLEALEHIYSEVKVRRTSRKERATLASLTKEGATHLCRVAPRGLRLYILSLFPMLP